MLKTIKFYTLVIVIGGLGLGCLFLYFFPRQQGEIRRVVDPPAIVEQIQKLSELVTVKYGMQKIIGLEEEKIPFGTEKLLLMVRAEVLAGMDLSKLATDDVTLTGERQVLIRLPAPTVLHVFVNEKDTQTWDRQKTWWTPWVGFNPQLDKKARLVALEAVQAAALEMGILRDAQQNAETAIRGVLRAVGMDSVQFAGGGEVLRDAGK